jgi:hypothetical protein|mmetsp:Transcript_4299/g.6693  ORF Transcript_4299/g.6693 Transcript_4299/m.6693 type:complete len:87 (+) Transcript_4299:215-475(+)
MNPSPYTSELIGAATCVSASDRRKRIGKMIRDAKKKRGAAASAAGLAPPEDGLVPMYDTHSVWTFSFWWGSERIRRAAALSRTLRD